MGIFSDLPDRVLAVLILRLDGYHQKEVVIILGVSRTTVWQDEHKAYGMLKEKLA